MLLEIGKQLQLTAELLARNCDLEWSQGSAITTMTATDLKELYQHIWHTTKWIQMHILARQRKLYCVVNLRKVLVFLLKKQERNCVLHITMQAHFFKCILYTSPDIFRVLNLRNMR